MREWVVGFLFDLDADKVVLIRKNRPEWQAGKLNGVGGKVEHDELPADAMGREFREETGVVHDDWHHFADLKWEEGIVHFYRAFVTPEKRDRCCSMTDEDIVFVYTDEISSEDVTPNLRWLIPLAAHRHDTYDVIDVVETGTTLRKPGRLDVLAGSPLGGLEEGDNRE